MITASQKYPDSAILTGNLTPASRAICAWFKEVVRQDAVITRLSKIKLVVADIDGSLTDGTIEYTKNSEGTRWFSTQDGYATRKAIERDILVAFLSGKGAESGHYRATMLGIPHDLCILGVTDKRPAVATLQRNHGIESDEVLMFGDDFLDAQVRLDNPKIFFATPSNSPFYIQNIASLTLPVAGGGHAFRLLIDLMLYAKGCHFAQEIIKNALG